MEISEEFNWKYSFSRSDLRKKPEGEKRERRRIKVRARGNTCYDPFYANDPSYEAIFHLPSVQRHTIVYNNHFAHEDPTPFRH
jgi:hypothetical protein